MSAKRQPPLYSNPAPVTAGRHNSMRLLPAYSFGYAREVTSLPLTAVEFQTASRSDASLQVTKLGHILSGKQIGRTSDQDITIVDLTGIAAQDIAITQAIIDAAACSKTQ